MPPQTNIQTEWPGAFKSLKTGFEAIAKNQQFALIYIVATSIGVFLSHQNPHSDMGVLITAVVSLALLVALIKYSLATAQSRVPSLSELFAPAIPEFLRLIGATLVLCVIVAISAIGLFIPLIWIVPWTSFVLLAIVDQHTGVFESFRLSKRLAQHHKSKVWGLIGAIFLYTIGASLLSLIPVIGWLATAVAAGVVGLATRTATARLYYFVQASEEIRETPNLVSPAGA